MSASAHLNIPLSFNQIIDLIKQLPKKQQEKLVSLIQEQDDFIIPEDVQQLVEERRKTAKASDYIARDQSNEKLKNKYGF